MRRRAYVGAGRFVGDAYYAGGLAGRLTTSGTVASGALTASYLTGQFPAGADVAQSGSSDYLRLSIPSGVSHVFWAHAGTSTQPSLSGSPTYHQVDVDGLEADAVTALFCQAIVNAGSPTPLWTISGYTQQVAPTNTVAPTVDNTTPAIGGTVNCSTGTWTGTPTGYTYQWKRGGVNIGGATSSAYVVSGSNGDVLTCAVVATNSVGSSSAATTSNSATITAAPSWTDSMDGASTTSDAGLDASYSEAQLVTLPGGTVSKLRLYLTAANATFSPVIKMALFNSSRGLITSGTSAALGNISTGTWVEVTVTPAVISGASYWIGFAGNDSHINARQLSGSGSFKFIGATGYSAFPISTMDPGIDVATTVACGALVS